MDKLDFAMSLIRAPWFKRLTDRTFMTSIGTALGAAGAAIAIWQTPGVPIDHKINITLGAFAASAAVIGAWNHSEKKKDREIAAAVLSSKSAETVNVATTGDVDTGANFGGANR